MRSLKARTRDDEQMDDPSLDPEVYDQVLKGLGRVNAWTFAARPTLSFLARATRGRAGFSLLDVQWVTPHLERFGAIEIPRRAYLKMLEQSLAVDAHF